MDAIAKSVIDAKNIFWQISDKKVIEAIKKAKKSYNKNQKYYLSTFVPLPGVCKRNMIIIKTKRTNNDDMCDIMYEMWYQLHTNKEITKYHYYEKWKLFTRINK